MKLRTVNEGQNGTWWVLDHIAEWDAPSRWERRRLAAMQGLISPGMTLYDVGTEFGWLSLIYGAYCGHENIVLMEPGTSFWSGIRKQWASNNLHQPLACVHGYIGATSTAPVNASEIAWWPECAELDRPEPTAMAYGSLLHDDDIPVYTVDQIAATIRPPDALTIDVEGAELEVLKGSTDVLMDQRPIVFVSVHEDLMVNFDTTPAALEVYMASFGYRGYDLGTDHEHHVVYLP